MNEKLMILKMLENGQINAAEAANLLQSIESPSRAAAPPTLPPTPKSHPTPRMDSDTSRHGNNGSRSGGGHGLDDLTRKFESFARDMAPKAQKFAESAAGVISGAADKVSKALSEAGSSVPSAAPQAGHTPRPAAPASTTGGTEQHIEMLVDSSGYNELSLSGLNGEVRVKGYNGDKITAKLTYRKKNSRAAIEMMKLGNKYFLKYEPDDFQSVSIDAYVPERAFSVFKADGLNCTVDCSSLAAGEMQIINANGNTRLSALAATNLTAEGTNGNFIISNVNAASATVENMNGNLETHELDIANLKLTNYNGPLSIIMSGFNRHASYIWNVETGNAKLNMNLPTMPTLGYHIKAHAAMSEIRLGLTGLQFLINESSLVEARSIHFDTAAKQVKLAVETSNAPLTIN